MLFDAEGASRVLLVFFLVWGVLDGGSSALAGVASRRGAGGTWAAKGCEIPNFKGSYLGRFPLVSADFWTSDHLSERPRSVGAVSETRARGTLTLKRR
jgi:hypothetical protein